MLSDRVLGTVVGDLGTRAGGQKKDEGMFWLCDGHRNVPRAG